MKIQCPTTELLRYFEAMQTNPDTVLPKQIKEHAKKCVHCQNLLNNPSMWNLFILANKRNNKRQAIFNDNETIEVIPGQIRLVKTDKNSDAAMALITETSKIAKYKAVNIVPIAITPFEVETDETDIVLEAKQTPMGLSALFEWWNDRPVLLDIVGKNFGLIDRITLKKIQKLIKNPVSPKNPTEDILVFREVEKAKGELLSASFYEKFFNENDTLNLAASSQNNKKSEIIITYTNLQDLNSSNEELSLAADSKDTYKQLKKCLNTINNNFLAASTDEEGKSFSIFAKNQKKFTLIVKLKDGSTIGYESNESGKLYLKNGLPKEFCNITIKQ